VALVVIPITTLVAADAAALFPGFVAENRGLLPPISKVFVQFSPLVYQITGGATLAIIGVLWAWRKTATSAVLSTGIFTTCVVFNVLALWALELPLSALGHRVAETLGG